MKTRQLNIYSGLVKHALVNECSEAVKWEFPFFAEKLAFIALGMGFIN